MQKPAVFVFDAYGTIVHNPLRVNPYKKFISDYYHSISDTVLSIPPMTYNGSFDDYADMVGSFTKRDKKYYNDLLKLELNAIYPCPHALSVLTSLKEKGYRLAVASNLAYPYAKPIREHYGNLLDFYGYSFQIGFQKPDERFYASFVNLFNSVYGDMNLISPNTPAMMVGDNYENDYVGPRSHQAMTSLWIGNENRQLNWYKFEQFIKDHDL